MKWQPGSDKGSEVTDRCVFNSPENVQPYFGARNMVGHNQAALCMGSGQALKQPSLAPVCSLEYLQAAGDAVVARL